MELQDEVMIDAPLAEVYEALKQPDVCRPAFPAAKSW